MIFIGILSLIVILYEIKSDCAKFISHKFYVYHSDQNNNKSDIYLKHLWDVEEKQNSSHYTFISWYELNRYFIKTYNLISKFSYIQTDDKIFPLSALFSSI